MNEETVLHYKREYAFALLKSPDDNLKAASEVFPQDPGVALKISNIWTNDNQVIFFQKEILEQYGEDEFLPTKNDFLKKVWDRMNKTNDDSDFVKLSDIYAKTRGFYPEINKNKNDNNFNFNGSAKVMILTSAGSDDDWEKKALEQQTKLLNS